MPDNGVKDSFVSDLPLKSARLFFGANGWTLAFSRRPRDEQPNSEASHKESEL
jgi:hypothetical protein